jgi:hypothetical protein
MSHSTPGVVTSGHIVGRVHQPDQPDIEIWHNREAGTEWLTLEMQSGDDPRVGFAALPDLIKELQRLKSFFGTPNLETPSYYSDRRWR